MDNHIQLLNLHASRIETLRFRANGDWAAGPALSDFLAVLSASPALRTLDIQGPNAGVWGFLEVEATRSSFPALRELMLMRLHVHGAWPTHNLTVLVLHDLSRAQPSWPELTTILQSSPDLKELSLTAFIIVNEGTEGSSVESPVNEPIALPRLEKLALWNMPAEVTSLILESIQASALQALIVGSTLHLPNLIPTITSSATTLRHLRLGCLSSEDPAILSALRIPLPKLERLGIFGGERFSPLYIHDAVFEAMVEYKQLTTLDFGRIFIGVDLLVGMIHWRRELDGCQAIKRVIFSDGCQTSKPWGDLKSSLLDLGAQIDFADEKEDGEGRDMNEDWFLEERSSTLSKVQVILICLRECKK
ncbi:hypothetical protein FRB98_005730 [Tulasnella sp. 332]|nr:hypothetical protein FRB98_005730 [Tulasnella sp. 332]